MESITFCGRNYKVGRLEDRQIIPLPPWLGRDLPGGWYEVSHPLLAIPPGLPGVVRDYLRLYEKAELEVMVSAKHYKEDGKRWMQLSVSRRDNHIPSWADMCATKAGFLGPERYAYEVHPPRAKYVNLHQGSLHLWHCLDGEPLPDFTCGGDFI
jgi:hypothetical protein